VPMKVEQTSRNGLPAVLLTHASGSSALIYIYAAHLASWVCGGAERLFVSSTAEYGGGKAIRGGVPVCWPQFAGRGALPKHGFVRTSDKWRVLRTSTEPYPCVVLELVDDDETRRLFPQPFKLQYSVTLDGPSSISMALSVLNTGTEPLSFTAALHTYFRVADVRGVSLHGLGGLRYEDNTRANAVETQPEGPLSIAGEVDRVYLDAPAEAHIVDGASAIKVLKLGFPDAVLWNIGERAAGGIKDLAPGEWQHYLCYEAGAVAKPATVPASASWTGGQTFSCVDACDALGKLSLGK